MGEISLKDATLVQDSNLQFQILTRSRNYFLRSDNEDNKNQCINSIQSAKQSFLSGDQSSANQSQKPAVRFVYFFYYYFFNYYHQYYYLFFNILFNFFLR